MTTFGITGHQVLPKVAEVFATTEMRRLITERRGHDLRGISSLAAGADQLLAEVILELNGVLDVVVPAADYERTFDDRGTRCRYRALLAKASEVQRLPFRHASEEAFWAAGRVVVERCDVVVAVWDGEAARGLGGTADIVGYARSLGREIHVLWPSGVRR